MKKLFASRCLISRQGIRTVITNTATRWKAYQRLVGDHFQPDLTCCKFCYVMCILWSGSALSRISHTLLRNSQRIFSAWERCLNSRLTWDNLQQKAKITLTAAVCVNCTCRSNSRLSQGLSRQDRFWAHPASLSMVPGFGVSSWGGSEWGRDVSHSPPSVTVVKNELRHRYTSAWRV